MVLVPSQHLQAELGGKFTSKSTNLSKSTFGVKAFSIGPTGGVSSYRNILAPQNAASWWFVSVCTHGFFSREKAHSLLWNSQQGPLPNTSRVTDLAVNPRTACILKLKFDLPLLFHSLDNPVHAWTPPVTKTWQNSLITENRGIGAGAPKQVSKVWCCHFVTVGLPAGSLAPLLSFIVRAHTYTGYDTSWYFWDSMKYVCSLL